MHLKKFPFQTERWAKRAFFGGQQNHYKMKKKLSFSSFLHQNLKLILSHNSDLTTSIVRQNSLKKKLKLDKKVWKLDPRPPTPP